MDPVEQHFLDALLQRFDEGTQHTRSDATSKSAGFDQCNHDVPGSAETLPVRSPSSDTYPDLFSAMDAIEEVAAEVTSALLDRGTFSPTLFPLFGKAVLSPSGSNSLDVSALLWGSSDDGEHARPVSKLKLDDEDECALQELNWGGKEAEEERACKRSLPSALQRSRNLEDSALWSFKSKRE